MEPRPNAMATILMKTCSQRWGNYYLVSLVKNDQKGTVTERWKLLPEARARCAGAGAASRWLPSFHALWSVGSGWRVRMGEWEVVGRLQRALLE